MNHRLGVPLPGLLLDNLSQKVDTLTRKSRAGALHDRSSILPRTGNSGCGASPPSSGAPPVAFRREQLDPAKGRNGQAPARPLEQGRWLPPIKFLAGNIKSDARQRPISPAWDRKQQISTSGSSPSWSRKSTPGAPGSECLRAELPRSSMCSSSSSSMIPQN
jgi:hypothetical protein